MFVVSWKPGRRVEIQLVTLQYEGPCCSAGGGLLEYQAETFVHTYASAARTPYVYEGVMEGSQRVGCTVGVQEVPRACRTDPHGKPGHLVPCCPCIPVLVPSGGPSSSIL